tara:strand:- start:2426 stop:2626 length:201 start_codon:yes stop_codon:yes gene_type:complete
MSGLYGIGRIIQIESVLLGHINSNANWRETLEKTVVETMILDQNNSRKFTHTYQYQDSIQKCFVAS